MTAGTGSVDPSAEPLRRWQEFGDLDALDELLRAEVGILKHMIRGRTGGLTGSAATSDIAQEAVLGLLKTRTPPTFDEPGALRGYLWKSAWNLLVTRYEKKLRAPLRVCLDEGSGFGLAMAAAPAWSSLDRDDRMAAIQLAMNLLSSEDRDLLKRVYFDGEDIATAGAAVGLTRDVANTRLVRARRLMATRLSEWADLIG